MHDNSASRHWLGLIALTLFAYALAIAGLSGRQFVLILLATALIKGQIIIDHFMMLKMAPLMWRILISAWLLLVLVVITWMYFVFG